ncbi:MAG: DDE-type integrase/transposase/recombinase [Cyanobacteria bacterium P01_D01_bin.73]
MEPLALPVSGVGEVRPEPQPGRQFKDETLNTMAVPIADRRLDLINSMAMYVADNLPGNRAALQYQFCELYSAGEIQPEKLETRASYPTCSRSQIKAWELLLKRYGYEGLKDQRCGRRVRKLDTMPDILAFMQGMVVLHPRIGKAKMLQAIEARFPGRDDLPSVTTVQRWLTETAADVAFVAATNPARYKNVYMAAFGSYSEEFNAPNQLWELDSTPADVMLEDGRYSVIGCIDVWSRRAMLLVSKTSRSVAIALLLRRCLLEWGVPKAIKTDNGKDYTSLHITRVVAELGIEHRTCQPFQPWQKPHIERFLGTFSHGLLEMLPGFIGHNVTERQAIRDQLDFGERMFKKDSQVEIRKTADEFQAFCDRWLEVMYLHASHAGLDGQTPWQRWSRHPAPLRMIADARSLDVLLAPTSGKGIRQVGKQGIRVDTAAFVHALLVDRIGQQVQVRFEPRDMGVIYVFDLQGKFLCEAICPERKGISRAELAAEAKRLQRQVIGEQRKTLKSRARAVKQTDVVEAILEQREEHTGKLVEMPRVVEEFSNPALVEAAKAADAGAAVLGSDAGNSPVIEPPEPVLSPEQIAQQADREAAREERDRLLPYPTGKRMVDLWKAGRANEITEEDLLLAQKYCFSGDNASYQKFLVACFGVEEERAFFGWLQPALKDLIDRRRAM